MNVPPPAPSPAQPSTPAPVHDPLPKEHRGSLLLTLVGAFLGAMLALGLLVWILMFNDPYLRFREAVGLVGEAGLGEPTVVLFAGGGAILGFFLAGLIIGNRLARGILSLVRRALTVIAGAAVGGLAGVAAYALAWMATTGTWSVVQAIPQVVLAANDGEGALSAFVLLGLVVGAIATTVAVARTHFRLGGRILRGGLGGAAMGILLYALGAVALHPPTSGGAAAVARAFAAAAGSLAPAEMLIIVMATTLGILLSRYSWRLQGVLGYISLVFVVLGYIAFTVTWTLPSVPPEHKAFSLALFVAELGSLGMVLLYSFYTIDVSARKHWKRDPSKAAFSPYYLPKVAIHVPTYNEPPGLVEATLRSLLALDYPLDRFVVMVGDDSTDPAMARPLRDFCATHGIVYVHRTDRRGYKAGALNGLLKRTPADATLIAVVDADYQVRPEFLREVVGHFTDPYLGWLQTPQDYRNRGQSFLTEQYFLADAYFYRTILPSRNEENSIIFCGTMGILRKRAITSVGGWSETCITEDAELSVRLLNTGWRSLYINRSYGQGLIPATFDGYKMQHYRWAFGGGRILRGHLGRFLFGRFTSRQRLDYLLGTLNWFEGLFLFAIAAAVLVLGVADVAGVPLLTHHANEVVLVGLVPVLLLIDGLSRVHLALRRTMHLGLGGTLRILGMWFSVKFSNAWAALKAVLGLHIPFLRTPKAPDHRLTGPQALWRTLRLTPMESTMSLLNLATAVGLMVQLAQGAALGDPLTLSRILLAFWLLYYALAFGAAPLYSYKSFVTLRPDPDESTAPPTSAPAVSA